MQWRMETLNGFQSLLCSDLRENSSNFSIYRPLASPVGRNLGDTLSSAALPILRNIHPPSLVYPVGQYGGRGSWVARNSEPYRLNLKIHVYYVVISL